MMPTSRNVMSPQFSSPPAEKSGIAKRSGWTECNVVQLCHCPIKITGDEHAAHVPYIVSTREKGLATIESSNTHFDRNSIALTRETDLSLICDCKY